MHINHSKNVCPVQDKGMQTLILNMKMEHRFHQPDIGLHSISLELNESQQDKETPPLLIPQERYLDDN